MWNQISSDTTDEWGKEQKKYPMSKISWFILVKRKLKTL